MTTLYNSYCMPKTDEEWRLITDKPYTETPYVYVGAVTPLMMLRKKVSENDTEISVLKFLDLLHDRIVPWRLEEVGFKRHIMDIDGIQFYPPHEQDYVLEMGLLHINVRIEHGKFFAAALSVGNGDEMYFIPAHGIRTFNNLLTQIRFITPPTE